MLIVITYRKSEIPDEFQQYFEPAELGLESTPEEYVERMVSVFREVRRVLRDDGVLFLNLGDTYAAGAGGRGDGDREIPRPDGTSAKPAQKHTGKRIPRDVGALKPKDLVGIPWRVAFALQADGWYLRQDIIWHKPNPMPESVTDRCTKAHEYIFLLSKSARYWYDADAIREDSADPIGSAKRYQSAFSGRPGLIMPDGKEQAIAPKGMRDFNGNRNRRSVWTVPTQPYSGAHFAVFPEKLITPCILAGCPVGGTVLDPFGGSGTTGETAFRLGRNSVLIELNQKYIDELMIPRASSDPLSFELQFQREEE